MSNFRRLNPEAVSQEELQKRTANERLQQESQFAARPVLPSNPNETEKEKQERRTREERARQEAQYDNVIVLPPKGHAIAKPISEMRAEAHATAQKKTADLIQKSEAESAARKAKPATSKKGTISTAKVVTTKTAAAPPPAAAAAPVQKNATFQNLGTDPAMAKAELYYESTRWGALGHGDPPVTVGTFPGHRWFIVANGTYAKLFTVGEEPDDETFTF